jgi:hypothetical protein
MRPADARLCTLAKLGKHFDGGGLGLEVTRWRVLLAHEVRHTGEEKRLAFDVYPEVSLKAAHRRRNDAREIHERGCDPAAIKRDARAKAECEASMTFEGVAREWLRYQASRWAPGTLNMILEGDVFPRIGSRPMAQLRPREVMEIVKAIKTCSAGTMNWANARNNSGTAAFAAPNKW